jgi:ABC-type bacteriocin/lantibiotic exporter with double-glycine peptidase domain
MGDELIHDSLEEISAVHHRSTFEYIRILFSAEREDLKIVCYYALGIGLLSLAVPVGVQSLVNSVAFGVLLQPIAILTVLVFLGMAISGLFSVFQSTVVEILQQRIFVRVALDLARRIPRFALGATKSEYTPQLMNRFFEVVVVQKAMSKLLLEGIAVLLQATIGLVILAFYHPLLLSFAIVLVLSVSFVFLVCGRGAFSTAKKESTAKHGVLIWLENIAQNQNLFKGGEGAAYAIKQADECVQEYISYRKLHFRVLLRQHVGFVMLQAVASAGLLGLGGMLVIEKTLTLGQLVASELIVSGVLTGITKLGKLLESLYDMVASLSKLDSLLDIPLEDPGSDCIPDVGKPIAVRFKDVSYRGSAGNLVLDSVSVSLDPGAKVAIVGRNASGKSLIAELLYDLSQPTSGCILLDGHALQDCDRLNLRDQIAFIKNVEVFRGTVEQNLRVGNDRLSFKELREALERVGLLADVEALPDQMHTVLGEDSWPLSKGKAIKLMIARVLLRRPRLLIIDEALDSLDIEVLDEFIVPVLTSNTAPWTLVVLSHNPDVARKFSTVFELNAGSLHRGV